MLRKGKKKGRCRGEVYKEYKEEWVTIKKRGRKRRREKKM